MVMKLKWVLKWIVTENPLHIIYLKEILMNILYLMLLDHQQKEYQPIILFIFTNKTDLIKQEVYHF